MKQYRIGEFAKYMGVTPDLLKHYEELGVITSQRSESGYRYYPFQAAMTLFESIRLRNYGLTLREIKTILTDRSTSSRSMEQRFDRNMDLLREESRFNQALVTDYEEFQIWKEPLETREYDWCIRRSRPMCFLPHTDAYDFLEDPRIYDILRDWMSHIPIVKSAMRVRKDHSVTWGLIVEQKKLEQLGLPTNDAVCMIPSHKVFYYQFRGQLTATSEERLFSEAHPAFRLIRAMNLEESGPFFRVTVMPSDWQQPIACQYGYYAIPLKE